MHTGDCLKTSNQTRFLNENMYYSLLHHPKVRTKLYPKKERRTKEKKEKRKKERKKKEKEYAGSKFCCCQNNVSTFVACFYKGERGVL